ncbi:hypothetical protein [Klebsiella pneumoniae]|uniref:hypothetical protein n=1 Tax=Klebsiella pneumoniae TaxID=573 RepID=UPI000ACE8710|nr:hypothetical protein [Klebsiella pneumoniae]
MTKSTITRERLQEIAEDGFLKHGESKELARMVLAATDSEPVAWTWHYREQWHVTNDEERARDLAWDGVKVEPLYRHAQPAPVAQCVPLGNSPYDVPHSMPSNLRELIAEEIGILFSDDDAQSVWDVCRRAAMLHAQSDDDGEPTDDERIMTIEGIHNCERCGDEGWVVGEMGITRCACGQAGNSPVIPDCWCRTCRPVVWNDMRFVVCPDCGNKRCPRENDHRNACTGSNEPGQEGSAYPSAPQEVKP